MQGLIKKALKHLWIGHFNPYTSFLRSVRIFGVKSLKPFIHRHLQTLHFKMLFFYEVQGFSMSPLFIGVSSITLRFFVKNKGLDSGFLLIIEV